MPQVCPCCSLDLEVGALRCRRCGADARGGRVEVRVSFELADLLPPDQALAVAVLDEIAALAPAVATWLRLAPATRGPRPDVHPSHRERVARLLAALGLRT